MRFDKGRRFNFSQNKDYIIVGLLGLTIILNLFSLSGSDLTYILTNVKSVENPELNQFCISFIDQILNKSLHSEMVESDIYEVLVQDDYKVLNLLGNEKPLFSRVKDNTCAVIIQDKLGLRRFEISVNKSFDYPFYYRVQKVDEPMVEG